MKKGLILLIVLAGLMDVAQAQHTIARVWAEELLNAVRNDLARPVVHARNLHHTSAAMYDIWTVFDSIADPYLLGKTVHGYTCDFSGFTPLDEPEEALKEAISHAAYNILYDRFRNSTGNASIIPRIRFVMDSLGYNWRNSNIAYATGSGAALGNYVARCYISMGRRDNSNEQLDYRNTIYRPVNPPLLMDSSGNPDVIDMNRWQPLALEVFIDQSGNVIPGGIQTFLGAEWGSVSPFALHDSVKTTYTRRGFDYMVYHDPGPPALIDLSGQDTSHHYQEGFEMVSIWSSHLDTADGVMIDISPASIGNNPDLPDGPDDFFEFYDFLEGGDASRGHDMNPVTGQPYPPNMVRRADYARVLAEFWADGPDSETPPGHWFTILNYVNDHPMLEKRYEGQGEELDDLEWDIKTYFLLGGTMHDAAISAWGIKGWYDYTRPVAALRAMAELGQRSDPNLPNYHPAGFQLIPGYIEQIQPGDSLAGPNDEYVNEIQLYTWKGPDYISDPDTDMSGVGWIRAKDWWPYQRPTFVTPNFAGYVSGHSTFSRAAAEVMTMITGDPFFPGGMGEFHAEKNEFLVFEEGPSEDIVLQWATYRDASDQTSLSRIWGGIHPPVDDIPGRKIGIEVGNDAYKLAHSLFYPDRDQDGFDARQDCDDNNDQVYPGAPEICDDVDNNCDGQVDEGLMTFRYFRDLDLDGFGNGSLPVDTCLDTAPPGFSVDSTDCNDRDAEVYPGAPELCDRKDNNCNGENNEGLTTIRYFLDADRDGFGGQFPFIDTCLVNAPFGFVANNFDCDDSNNTVYPGAPELCDSLDNDCDGELNNNIAVFSYFEDRDQDGFGDPRAQIDTCLNMAPAGYVFNNRDCDDSDPDVNPDAKEICDALDNNCDGQINEGLPDNQFFRDEDGDGFGMASTRIDTCLDMPPSGYVNVAGDCDDNNPDINPMASELCDSLDNNCDGQVNEGLTRYLYFADADGDGFGATEIFLDTCLDTAPTGYVEEAGDCDDNNPDINPDAQEVCDGIDNNCNGEINEGLATYTYYLDSDGDGFGDMNAQVDTCLDTAPAGSVDVAGDCDDNNPDINPDAEEICDDVDNNCDGQINEGLTIYRYYIDYDGDGYGETEAFVDTCASQPFGAYVTEPGDCHDGDASVYPGAPELCDNLDNNCNGQINEGLTIYTYYRDLDDDGYGNANMAIDTCLDVAPNGFVSMADDCNDMDDAINPGAIELCDALDNNCDGQVNEGLTNYMYWLDADGDGFGDPGMMIDTCADQAPMDYVENDADCDDSDAAIYPGADEVAANGIDEDCDGEDLLLDNGVFPNPFMDQITIYDDVTGPIMLFVQSIDGKIVWQREVEFVNQSYTIDLADLPRGVYFIRGYHPTEEEVFSYKVIKDIGQY